MSEFKFGCPACGQHIKADLAATGRQVNCPSCGARLLIPAPSNNPAEIPAAILIGARKAPAPAPALATRAAAASAPPPSPALSARPASPHQPAAPVLKPGPVPTPVHEKATAPVPPTKTVAPAATVTPATAAPIPKWEVAIPTPAMPPAPPAPTEKAPVPTAAIAPAPAAKPTVPPVPPLAAEPPAGAAPIENQNKPQVAALTSALKRELVRSVRARLANESKWMPRKTESGKFAYAAKLVGRELVPVPITSAEATHFSLLGAVLLEFHLRNVTQTATGRKEFLDGEIVAAIRQVTQSSAGLPAGAATPTGQAADPMAMTHAQCLQALDLLDQRYSREAEVTQTTKVERRTERIQLSDLVRKLEKQAPVTAEEVATALCHELEEVNRRLAELERASGQGT